MESVQEDLLGNKLLKKEELEEEQNDEGAFWNKDLKGWTRCIIN